MKKLALLLFGLALAAGPGTGHCGPMLNEVMADPASDWDHSGAYDFKNDEWVEVVNMGDMPLDLSGYFLGDELGNPVYGLTGQLAARSALVVYGSDAVAWESANGESTTGLRLGNDGDTVTLWQVANGLEVLVDSYTFNTYEAEDDRSSGRTPDGEAAWELYDALNPYTGATPPLGNGKAPSPGELNSGGGPPSPLELATWGRLKGLYATD